MHVNDNAAVEQYPQTKFFQACRGVFEGGGCRGAGHIGAYEAAIKCGVNFSEVAGTSAGSIIAVLVGAGANEKFLYEKCAYLKFSTLLAEPKKRISTFWWGRAGSLFFKGKNELFGKILKNGSAYSSEKLEDWLDDLLSELLPNKPRPIKFSDLILPTWVIATDLAGRRPKIWSTKDTPDAKVAMAVRSSCSIPLFFEPVESGNDFFVDGGMLSNLPSFVFDDQGNNSPALGGRILAFRLVEHQEPKTEWTLSWLVHRLIDTIISGATDLQIKMQSNISSVNINTDAVSSINFNISTEEVKLLLDSGRAAVKDFIQNEHSELNDSLASDVARYSEDELFDDLVREMVTPGKRLVVSCSGTKWYWRLFPSIAHWMFAGAEVDILVKSGSGDTRENHRRDLLKKMGAKVIETDQIPLNCFLLSHEDNRHNSVFIQDISATEYSPRGVVYIGTKHRPMIEILLKQLDQLLGSGGHSRPKLTLEEDDSNKLISLLKQGVHQYRDPKVKIEIQQVSLKQETDQAVKMIVRRVRSYKYRQIAHLAVLYEKYGIPFCKPAKIMADGQYVSSVTPPVMEKWGNNLVVIEGNTRVFYLNRMGVDSLYSLVVNNIADHPLPGRPINPREALLSTYQLPHEERISEFNYENFRSIEGAVRPTKQES